MSRPSTNRGAGHAGPTFTFTFPCDARGTTTYTSPPNGDANVTDLLESGSSMSTSGARRHTACDVRRHVVVPTRTRSPSRSAPSGNVTVSGSPAAAKSPVPCHRGTDRSTDTSRVTRRADLSGMPGYVAAAALAGQLRSGCSRQTFRNIK